MKSKNKKLIVILTISAFFLLNAFALTNGLAKTIDGDDATFNLDKEDPEGYGAIIPSPNTMGRISIDGSNQGKFTLLNWLGGSTGYEEIVSDSGEDISLYYPTYLDDYLSESYTKTDINPWSDIRWLNISAYNAEAETLSPFTLNSVFDYYVLGEGGSLNAPVNYKHPLQIDVIVKSGGPKVLQFDWLMVNPAAASYSYYLISPSGIEMDVSTNHYDWSVDHVISPGTVLFNYLIFTATEVGSYRLLFDVDHTATSSLYLEFLDTKISSLPTGTVKFGGNSDGILSIEEGSYADWQSQWFRISGKKGDLFRLDLFEDYAMGVEPIIDIWTPCGNAYLLDFAISPGTHEIYFAKSGYAYISFTDWRFGDWYRYSLYLNKIENVQYTLGDELTSIMLSNEERKSIQFSLQEDSIVRFNYTSLPLGNPEIYAFIAPRAFIYRDSNAIECFDINTAIFTQTVGPTDFYWHYMPAGTYRAIVKNTDTDEDGIFQISSQVYDWSEVTIPVNTLTYPTDFPSDFVTIEFQPDSEFLSLKNPVGIDIEIPDIGQFRLNTTFWASDNPETATGFPSYLYMYNSTGPADYYSFGYPQPAFSLDGDSTAGDYLYIGSSSRWTGMVFDFSVLGVGGTIGTPEVDDGTSFDQLPTITDGTSGFTTDGTIELDITDADFDAWVKGADGLNIDPGLDENDYYWMRVPCTGDYSTVPIIQQLTLLNLTIEGDLQFILIGETGYEYDDYWGPSGISQPGDPTNLEVSLDDDDGGSFNVDDRISSIIRAGDPMTIGFEPGTYKLLIIPEEWDYNGSVRIQFAVENYWDYAHYATYDIGDLTPIPNLHAIDITNYTLIGYSNITGSVYDYGLITEYNHTESTLPYGGGQSYFALECFGAPYQWTQLVATVQGLGTGDYNLYILQDLPWIDTGGPNFEVREITPGGYDVNRAFEFGVFSAHFTLLFEVDSSLENVTFYLSLSQYDTVPLTTSDVKASYTPPLSDALILALAIGIPAAAGAVIVVYVLKKKGKILTKRPS